LVVVEADRSFQKCSCKNKNRHTNGKHEIFRYKKATLFFKMSKKKLYDLIDSNKMVFEFRLHKPLGKPSKDDHDPKHDRGSVFRVSLKNLESMYKSKQEIIFSKN